MTVNQIREIVRITIEELESEKLLTNNPYKYKLKYVANKIKAYFSGNGDGYNISYALHCLSDDPYIDLIYLQYRDGKTLEWIAEYYKVDVSTIKRNKKRLINEIYEIIRGEET